MGFFTIFSSFLCSASLEKKDKSFRGHFPGSCVPYFHIFWPKRNIERGWGTGGKNRTCPPHTHTYTCQWHFHQRHISSVAAALLQGLWPLLTPFSVGWSCFLLLFFLGCLPIHWLFSHLFHISNQFKFPLYHIVKWKRTKIEKLEVQSNVRVQFF